MTSTQVLDEIAYLQLSNLLGLPASCFSEPSSGEYIYRLVASDMYSNTAHQDFYVTVKGNGIADSVAEAVSNAVKTGDSLPIAGVAGIAVVAAGAAGVAAKKRREGKEDAR